MSLEYAVLGFLNYQPFSGYDLKKMFDSSVQHFWVADLSQIYRTLGKLSEKGWAHVEVVEQSERPDRKLYRITPQGQAALREWLAGPFPTAAPHSGPLVQVFFSGQMSDAVVQAKFAAAADLFRGMLERYQQVPQQVQPYVHQVDSPRETYFWMKTLELGMLTMQAQLMWAEQVLRDLEQGAVPPLDPPQEGEA